MNHERIEWFDERFYKIFKNGETLYYPSVTTVLGIINQPWLLRWYADLGWEQANYRSKLAKERGSIIHEFIARLINGEEIEGSNKPQQIWYQVCNFQKFVESLNPKFILSETDVCSHMYGVCGTQDMLVYIEEGEYNIGLVKPVKIEAGYYVGDVKTGNLDNKAFYQCAAYAMFDIEQEYVKDIQGTFIIQTDTEETKHKWKATFRTKEEMEIDFNCFLAALTLFRAEKEKKPKIFDMPKIIKLTNTLEDYYGTHSQEN